MTDYNALHSKVEEVDISDNFDGVYREETKQGGVFLAGTSSLRLRRINPIFNVRYDYLAKAKAYYRGKT